MTNRFMRRLTSLIVFTLIFGSISKTSGQEPLPSWADTPTKRSIVQFVERVTGEGADFVPPAERIAVFDNDGTLWCEQPIYIQLAFALDRVKQMADDHPEWKDQQPFKAVPEDDHDALIAAGKEGLLKIVAVTHAGMTTDEFDESVAAWLETARHPRFDRKYAEMVYQPMLELLDYLRENDFKTYIVSGGGIDFMRVFSEEVYGIPPEQVIGSSIKTQFQMRTAGPVIERIAEVDFVDDKEGKPVGIQRFIGRRPIAAFGNSDGDLQMLQWTVAGDGPRLAAIVHHTDDEREWAYDRDSHIGRLDKALDEAVEKNWILIDMKEDWKQIFNND